MMRWIIAAGGVALVAVVVQSVHRRWAQAQQYDPALEIKPPTYSYYGHDEALALRTQQRREASAGIRQRASALDSGAKTSAVLKMAAKR